MTLPELVVFNLPTVAASKPNWSWAIHPGALEIFKYLYERRSRVKIAVFADWAPPLIDNCFTKATVEINGSERSLKSLIAPGCLVVKVANPRAGSSTEYFLQRMEQVSGVALAKMLVFDYSNIYGTTITALGATFFKGSTRGLDLTSFKSGLKHYDDGYDDSSDRPDDMDSDLAGTTSVTRNTTGMQDMETQMTIHSSDDVNQMPPWPEQQATVNAYIEWAHLSMHQYKKWEDLDQLEAWVENCQQAVNLTPEGSPEMSKRLHMLADALEYRYIELEHSGELDTARSDLDAALAAQTQAVELTPNGHPTRAENLCSLSLSLTNRYQWLGELNDLHAALKFLREAVEQTPEGNPDKPDHLLQLGQCLEKQYKKSRDLKDLDDSLQAKHQAVALTSGRRRSRALCLDSLGHSLEYRYKRLGDLTDLKAAIKAVQEAVELTPEKHPRRPRYLQSLASYLTTQYKRCGNLKDLEAIHTHYAASFKSTSMSVDPKDTWAAAVKWASFSAELQSTEHCLLAYRTAFQQLPEVLSIGHSISVRHDAIQGLGIAKTTSTAVKTLINSSNLTDAVEIIEQGVSTVFQQILQLNTDVDGLTEEDAEHLKEISAKLHTRDDHLPLISAGERNELLNTIRKREGFEYFLLSKPYNVLCHASQGGPVVLLNSHKDQCDAIIILNPVSGPVHISLPSVTAHLLRSQRHILKELLDHCSVRNRGEESSPSRLFGERERISPKPIQECFEDLLAWLWTHIVSPIYQVLESNGVKKGRIWWMPTGSFTGLPLHAVVSPMDQFIHSYTVALGPLLDAHTRSSPKAFPRVSVVGVTHTGPGDAQALKGVKLEVEKVVSIASMSSIKHGKKPGRLLEGEKATVTAVKRQLLLHHSWVHLACHGYQNSREPTKSHLSLYGGVLELETILRMPLKNPQFVFLAACQTAMGDAQLVNESFHLGGGFIAAGFRSAIGTLWSMADEDGPIVSDIVYSHLFRDGHHPQASETAEALHLAVRHLQNTKVPFHRWIPFIHMGI